MSGSTYILEGRESELAQHSGHQVEVTGTLASASGSTGSTTGAASSGSTTGAPGGAGAAGTTTSGTTAASGGSSSASAAGSQHIQVTSVRMISSTCPQ